MIQTMFQKTFDSCRPDGSIAPETRCGKSVALWLMPGLALGQVTKEATGRQLFPVATDNGVMYCVKGLSSTPVNQVS